MLRAIAVACGLCLLLGGLALVGTERIVLSDLGARFVTESLGPAKRSSRDSAGFDAASLADATISWARSRVVDDPGGSERLCLDPPAWCGYAGVSVGFVTLLFAAAVPGPKPERRR